MVHVQSQETPNPFKFSNPTRSPSAAHTQRRMAMRRMNEMWRRMALTFFLSVLVLHSCPGEANTTVDLLYTGQTTTAEVVTSTKEDNTQDTILSTQHMQTTIYTFSNLDSSDEKDNTTDLDTLSQNTTTFQMDKSETTEQDGTSFPETTTVRLNELHQASEQTSQNDIQTIIKMGIAPPRSLNPEGPVTSYVNITCVNEKAVQGKNAVKVELKDASSCGETVFMLTRHIQNLCVNPPCNYKIYQEDNSKNAIITGEGVEEDVTGMGNRIEAVKGDMNIVSVQDQPTQRPNVFVPVLLSGLVLAAGLIGLYVWKNRSQRKAKNMKLAEASFMADEENQGNTLVSVAPLNTLESQDKTSQNGEFLDSVKTQNPPAATNGHSATKSDTEL